MLQMPTKMGNEEYLTSDEAAKMLGYSRTWFDTHIVDRYHLKKYRQGVRKRPILYKKSDVEALTGIRPMEEPPEK
jgi:predicted DNA-binding transcriptional regulator AlpA